MIIPEKRVYYIKIPKTGSTSVAQTIWDQFGVSRLEHSAKVVNLNRLEDEPVDHHGWHVDLARVEQYLGESFGSYRGFSVIREPVSRVQSVYRWAKDKQPDHPCLFDFDYFIQAMIARDDRLSPQALLHGLPQWTWLTDHSGAVGNLTLFTLEHLDDCASFYKKHLGFRPNFRRQNPSNAHETSLTYDGRRALEENYAEDFELHEQVRAKCAKQRRSWRNRLRFWK